MYSLKVSVVVNENRVTGFVQCAGFEPNYPDPSYGTDVILPLSLLLDLMSTYRSQDLYKRQMELRPSVVNSIESETRRVWTTRLEIELGTYVIEVGEGTLGQSLDKENRKVPRVKEEDSEEQLNTFIRQ